MNPYGGVQIYNLHTENIFESHLAATSVSRHLMPNTARGASLLLKYSVPIFTL
jgi:hypothetical protein